MSHAIEFIETPTFTRQIQAIATDDEFKELQRTLIAQPDKGDLIQGTGGLRKIRMPLGHQGKSGGARVIYLLATAERIYLILAYPKSVKDSLSLAEKAALKNLTRQLKGEASA
ncbi:RelE toxin of RelE / RelB toxin-antitoxin system [Halomonas shengliensis]|uniref:RelE toxin of RelE / RelB toxin-antitoxin system n=1 Tax=Halomonas shengliensis TaxID=419597 RepID=A0A1H0GTT8_9GAMM|nr:type II toxin-antitoxin system RelE/ParE family toxin [Halomonas shengliensis]SDO10244.1 RelE toxin of RelE / RelB toxin-antitoxin system [Halomonas shengliensis]